MPGDPVDADDNLLAGLGDELARPLQAPIAEMAAILESCSTEPVVDPPNERPEATFVGAGDIARCTA